MECLSGDYAHFWVDDLLDFPKEDETMADSLFGSLPGNSGDSSTVTAVESCNSTNSGGGDGHFYGNFSSRSFTETRFPGHELCVPKGDIYFGRKLFLLRLVHGRLVLPLPRRRPVLLKQKKNQILKGNRFRISITVMRSAGPIRFVVNEDNIVAAVIDTSMKLYAREGRLPILGSDLKSFILYCAIDGTEALCPWETSGTTGLPNFMLCKKPQIVWKLEGLVS